MYNISTLSNSEFQCSRFIDVWACQSLQRALHKCSDIFQHTEVQESSKQQWRSHICNNPPAAHTSKYDSLFTCGHRTWETEKGNEVHARPVDLTTVHLPCEKAEGDAREVSLMGNGRQGAVLSPENIRSQVQSFKTGLHLLWINQ